MPEGLQGPEQLPVNLLSSAVTSAHNSFLSLVSGFNRDIWVPKDALDKKAGSCAAEAFFVARKLIDTGVVREEDLSLGVFTNHGEDIQRGLISKTVKHPGHAVLFVTFNGQTYELNFRMYRADEKPALNRINEESLSEDRLKWIEPIGRAFQRYGEELNDSSGLRLGFDNCVSGLKTGGSHQVRFDQNF